MVRFNKIYLFATENIKDYIKKLDLTDKKIISVACSLDHALNAILLGCKDVTVFDINQESQYYIDLKLQAIKELNFIDFCEFLLYENEKSFNIETIKKLNLEPSSKEFWLSRLKYFNNDGLSLRKSDLIDTKYYSVDNKIMCNLYLNEDNYKELQEKLKYVNIKFIHSDLKDLTLTDNYDYGFFANISDYLNLMYDEEDYLEEYKKKIDELKKNIKTIYFAYIYDVDKKEFRTEIDNIEKVKEVFKDIEIVRVPTALIGVDPKKEDAVLIINN